jgi:hypothetical protein
MLAEDATRKWLKPSVSMLSIALETEAELRRLHLPPVSWRLMKDYGQDGNFTG